MLRITKTENGVVRGLPAADPRITLQRNTLCRSTGGRTALESPELAAKRCASLSGIWEPIVMLAHSGAKTRRLLCQRNGT